MASGTVSDDLAFSPEISITNAGSEITPSPDGTFSKEVSLESGPNDIEVTASDSPVQSGPTSFALPSPQTIPLKD